jgi:hypothetical protein
MDEDQDTRPRGSVDFVESSVLDTILPSSNAADFEAALSGSLETADETNGFPLAGIAQRKSLYFGMFDSPMKEPKSYSLIDIR